MQHVSIFAVLLAAVLTIFTTHAQPLVNAPLLPMIASVEGIGTATSGAVHVAGWFFAARTAGVYGFSSDTASQAFDALPGVTQILAAGSTSSPRLIAICGSSIVAYTMNATAIRRAAQYTSSNGIFDLETDLSALPSNVHPALMLTSDVWMLVVGTSATSPGILSSAVMAFNTLTLQVVWSTMINSNTANFAVAFDDTFVYFLAQNRTFSYGAVRVQKLFRANGTLVPWHFDAVQQARH